MSAQSNLRQAIVRMQDGQVATAVEMLNRLVTASELDDKGRAAAYVWLAESRADSAFKIRCLERALSHDPENRQIRQGLEQVKASRPPPGQLPALDVGRGSSEWQEAPPVLGILGGMNGLASGVFINRAGPDRHNELCHWRVSERDGPSGCGTAVGGRDLAALSRERSGR